MPSPVVSPYGRMMSGNIVEAVSGEADSREAASGEAASRVLTSRPPLPARWWLGCRIRVRA